MTINNDANFQRADPNALAAFNPRTKVCTMNCGPTVGDPRSQEERRFLCPDCVTVPVPSRNRANDLFSALLEFHNAFCNRDETTSLHVWNERMKSADENAVAVLNAAPPSDSQPDTVAVPSDVVIAAANKLKLIGQIYDGDKESRRLSEQLRVAQEARLNGDCEALNLGRIWLSDSSLKTWFPFTAEELERLRAEKAALRHYAIALQKAAEPFCAIKADDGDTLNGYAPETIIRLECSVQEIRRLRMCAGYGLPSSGTAVDNQQEAK